jgi:hypothetical protein
MIESESSSVQVFVCQLDRFCLVLLLNEDKSGACFICVCVCIKSDLLCMTSDSVTECVCHYCVCECLSVCVCLYDK